MTAQILRRLLAATLLSLAAPVWAQQGGVPVTVATVVQRDVPVMQRTIGTVQAFQSVLVRARVDGTLDQIQFTEGQHVKPGDVLAQLDPRPYQAILDQAIAKKAADEAITNAAKLDLVRYNELAASQAASRQKLEATRAVVEQAEASVRGDDALIAAARLNLSFTRVTSPIDGRVGLRIVDPGNFIRVADPNTAGLVTIAQIQPIALVFTLPQDALPRVQAAMKSGRLKVVAYSSDDKTLLSEGVLMTMDSTIDSTTGTIKLKAAFGNIDDALWPGQFVNVRMQTDVRRGALTVPSAAVQRGPNGLYVFIVKPDGTASVQPVELDQDDGEQAVVAKGLNAGDRVVIAGQSRLTNGIKVTATEPKTAS